MFHRASTALAFSAPTWLKAPGAALGARLGQAVASSAAGDVVVAGAPGEGSGAAHVFTLGSAWGQSAVLHASNAGAADQFGSAVSLSADGATLAVGAPQEDSGGLPSDDSFVDSGAVYVLQLRGTTWNEVKYLKASNRGLGDLFGGVTSLSADGETLAIGAVGESSAAIGVDGDQLNDAASYAGAAYVF